jgi:hypothetical protein
MTLQKPLHGAFLLLRSDYLTTLRVISQFYRVGKPKLGKISVNVHDLEQILRDTHVFAPSKEVNRLVELLLSCDDLYSKEIESLYVVDILNEFVHRITEVRSSFGGKRSRLIAFWLEHHWDEENFELSDAMLSVAVNLDTPINQELLGKWLRLSKNDEMKQLIQEAIDEI